jgi:gamma-glutamyltranspeptidase/glutathione hydrolase
MTVEFQYQKFTVIMPVQLLFTLGKLLICLQWQHSEKLIQDASPNAHEMLLNGKAPLPGQIMKFPNLAKTFRAVAEQGKDGFYKGRIAEAIVELVQSKGGVMELDDLAKHETSFVEPIKYTYAGDVTVYEVSRRKRGLWVDANFL